MGKAERRAERFLGINKESKEPVVASWHLPSFLTMDWYFSSWVEKAIIVLSFIALLWTAFKRISFGAW